MPNTTTAPYNPVPSIPMPFTTTPSLPGERAGHPAGARLTTADGHALPLKATRLVADACAGRARVTLEQRFVNTYDVPLTVTYHLPLPAEGAVSGFAFALDGERTLGVIEKRGDARGLFEQALADGKTAALLEQHRSSVFQQELGNIPPGKEVSIEVVVDQPLTWSADGWEWRWPCVVAPRYLGASGRVSDAESLTLDVLEPNPVTPVAATRLTLSIRDVVSAGAAPKSPSHVLSSVSTNETWLTTLGADEHAPLDRDLVVRWSVARATAGLTLDARRVQRPNSVGNERAFGLLTIVPPGVETAMTPLARDLIVLLDVSGSMSGAPIAQAKRVASALVSGLGPRDSFELVAFGAQVSHFEATPIGATDATRSRALTWIAELSASGGTEMRTGIVSALAGVRADSQRQVLLITDGLIGFESEIVAEIIKGLPASSRLHTLGIGSAVNRSLTGPASRAGRGSEHIVGVDEDVEPVLSRLLAKLEAPVLTNLRISGSALLAVALEQLPDVHAASPVSVPVELAPHGGALVIKADTALGPWRQEVNVNYRAPSEPLGKSALATTFARERVEELELRHAAGHEREMLDRAIEELGLYFGIATRMTSWIAVRETASGDPRSPTRRMIQPQALPYGTSAEGMGLRRVAAPMLAARTRGLAEFACAPVRTPFPAAPLPSRSLLTKTMGRPDDEEGLPKLTLRGKLVLQNRDLLIVEVAVGSDFDWALPAKVTVLLANLMSVELAVDARSTASVRLRAGESLRLVLSLTAPLGDIPIVVTTDSIEVDLSR